MFVEYSVKVEIALIYAAGAFEDKTIVAGSETGKVIRISCPIRRKYCLVHTISSNGLNGQRIDAGIIKIYRKNVI